MRALKIIAIAYLLGAGFGARAEISVDTLSAEIGARVSRVAEFRAIREKAKEMGVPVFLFGSKNWTF